MALDNVSFGIYINVTCGIGQEPACTDDPPGELIDWHMAGVARHVDNFKSHTTFYEQAAKGNLPAFSWVSPNIEACDHPCHDIAKGERQLKDIYEALRAGPKWAKTLFLVAYDDIGGCVPIHSGTRFQAEYAAAMATKICITTMAARLSLPSTPIGISILLCHPQKEYRLRMHRATNTMMASQPNLTFGGSGGVALRYLWERRSLTKSSRNRSAVQPVLRSSVSAKLQTAASVSRVELVKSALTH
jgi:hypothetical protein